MKIKILSKRTVALDNGETIRLVCCDCKCTHIITFTAPAIKETQILMEVEPDIKETQRRRKLSKITVRRG